MTPKDRSSQPKGKGKGTTEEQKDVIQFGYPQPLVASLQANSAGATAALYKDPVTAAVDQSAQQVAQSQANALDKLSKD